MSSHATLSAAADDRKARLAKLKSLKRKQPSEDQEPAPSDLASGGDQADENDVDDHHLPHPPRDDAASPSPAPPSQDVARLHLSGRNYDPETRGPKLGFEAPPTLALRERGAATLEEQARGLEDESRRAAAADARPDRPAGIDLSTLQPRRPNWDLKREYGRKMEALNVRTENAIARMVRERLAEKKRAAGAAAGGSGEGADGGGKKEGAQDGDAESADGMLDGTAILEGMRMREREEEEEARREREAEAEEFGTT